CARYPRYEDDHGYYSVEIDYW
nr:immunoglobulin heavy chain junction region [Macaca mulatta]MOX58606.1 immunoglobulin heavy chain junction region [Macaca mulatta]MOX61644.1 immunoglobulin heavy chain junction region [Macaca mulatta]MOX61861.1 immunoglobulin heavy chain junction region [Macaca mulatta]MOX62933.1 immunoglobulin heavy chain junction region [Macaca mulatta]